MKTINFSKFHGFGNDYIVVENDRLKDVESIPEFARKICHRHHGAGSDGIAILEKLADGAADYSCRIINPDGSEGSFSGNGTRCAVAFLHFKKIRTEKNLRLSTLSGVKNYTLLERDEKTFWFLAEIGKPKFAPDEIPFKTQGNFREIVDYQLPLENNSVKITAVNPGNPVAAIFTEDFDKIDWRKIGQKIESHPQFPEKTNVVFIKNVDSQNIEIRIWERGAAETSSSGTCSAAAAVAHLKSENSRGLVYVHAPGGTTQITWREDDELLLNGRADFAYDGTWIL